MMMIIIITGIQFGKQEVKLPLFLLYMENPVLLGMPTTRNSYLNKVVGKKASIKSKLKFYICTVNN